MTDIRKDMCRLKDLGNDKREKVKKLEAPYLGFSFLAISGIIFALVVLLTEALADKSHVMLQASQCLAIVTYLIASLAIVHVDNAIDDSVVIKGRVEEKTIAYDDDQAIPMIRLENMSGFVPVYSLEQYDKTNLGDSGYIITEHRKFMKQQDNIKYKYFVNLNK